MEKMTKKELLVLIEKKSRHVAILQDMLKFKDELRDALYVPRYDKSLHAPKPHAQGQRQHQHRTSNMVANDN